MLQDTIQQAMYAAMKQHNETDVKVLRYLLSQVKYEEISRQKQLTDEEVLDVLAKELKKRKESIEMYRTSGRTELVDDEVKQVKIIESYLPAQMSEEELNAIIQTIVSSIPDTSNAGKVIGAVMARVKGKADGAVVSRLVMQYLKR